MKLKNKDYFVIFVSILSDYLFTKHRLVQLEPSTALVSILARDAEPEPEPEPEPPEPTHFGRSRSRSWSRRNGLLGAGAAAGAVKNGAAPATKRDAIVARIKNNSEITRNSRTNSLPKFFINN